MRLGALIDVLFPPACANCDAIGSGLCERCFPHAEALQFTIGALHCIALGAYEGALRRAILALKSGRRDVAEALGVRLRPYVALADAVDALIPVPTTTLRRRQRGFDQGELLARVIARPSAVPVAAALVQIAGDAQRGRSRSERLAAVGRFSVVAASLGNARRVILVDDVATTGASLTDCAAALRAAGVTVTRAIVAACAGYG